MIKPDESVLRAMVRLGQTPDFKKFLDWIEEEKAEVKREWMDSLNPVRIHQLQGAARLLEDMTQTAMSAPQEVAAINRASA